MKKALLTLLIITLCIFSFGCKNTSEKTMKNTNSDAYINQLDASKDKYITIAYSDITHNGVQERLVLDITQIEESQNARLVIADENNNIVWEDTAGLPHVGWNSIYLYSNNGEDYILRYNPSISQGIANYQYQLFYLNENGIEKNIDSRDLSFDITMKGYPLDIDKIVEFVDKVNEYLSNSYLLVSTENSNLEYSTQANKVVRIEELEWLTQPNIDFDTNDTLVEKLEKYQEYLKEQQ